MWDIAAAKAEGQIDWELDISRFKENATINNWLWRIRCAMVAFKMYISCIGPLHSHAVVVANVQGVVPT
jgi:hypothetical protein